MPAPWHRKENIPMQPKLTPEQRFWSKVDPCRTDGCFLWVGSTYPAGYGAFWLNGKMTLAHHFLIGKAPEGYEWDHLCHTRKCVRPQHVEAVSHQQNYLRGERWQLDRTHCPLGHPYNEDNTYITPRGHRVCRKCDYLRTIKKRARRALRIQDVAVIQPVEPVSG